MGQLLLRTVTSTKYWCASMLSQRSQMTSDLPFMPENLPRPSCWGSKARRHADNPGGHSNTLYDLTGGDGLVNFQRRLMAAGSWSEVGPDAAKYCAVSSETTT